MIFPQRIIEIANMIPEKSYVADVGADHGLLELYLLTHKNFVFTLAIENKKGPYEILKENLIAFKQIRLSLSDGLTAVDTTIDTIVLAGMGGYNICSILSKYPKKVKQVNRIIVDPHKDIDVVRETIINYGFDIELEKIVLENNKYYNLISFIRNDNHRTYSDLELKFGYKEQSLLGSLVYLGNCYSGREVTLAQTFLKLGAEAVIANSHTIQAHYNSCMEYTTIKYLTILNPETNKTYTLYEALCKAKEIYGKTDQDHYQMAAGSEPMIFGNPNFCLSSFN